jgi:RNA polymerase sigma factor (sigma-70 family)
VSYSFGTMADPDADPADSMLAVRHWLERHRAGDESARQELIEISMRRLRLLARKILCDIPLVRRFEETDDLLQNSLVRLWKCLADTKPGTAVDYFRLAACLIRRELIDLSRHHSGAGTRQQDAASSVSGSGTPGQLVVAPADDTFDPQKLTQWTEFHEYVERLDAGERDLFDLLWYQGLTMAETSELLEIPLRTLGRRWKTARVKLYRDLLAGPGEAQSLTGQTG